MHFWLDVVCLSPCIINAQPWRSTLPLNPFNGKGGSQRFCQSLSTLQHCSERVRDFTLVITMTVGPVMFTVKVLWSSSHPACANNRVMDLHLIVGCPSGF